MFLDMLVISTDIYTPFQIIDFVNCIVSAELVQTSSQPHNLKTVSTICGTRNERQPDIYCPCASG